MLDAFLPHMFHNFALSESVEYARHALSIDEERKTFLPVLWDKLPENQPTDKMKQVWFAGVHTDVGGGYAEDDLANISLNWMIREAKVFGLRIYENAPAYKTLNAAPYNPNGIMHNEQLGVKGMIFKRKTRFWNSRINGLLTIHESVFKRTKNPENGDSPIYKPWILGLSEKEKFQIEQ